MENSVQGAPSTSMLAELQSNNFYSTPHPMNGSGHVQLQSIQQTPTSSLTPTHTNGFGLRRVEGRAGGFQQAQSLGVLNEVSENHTKVLAVLQEIQEKADTDKREILALITTQQQSVHVGRKTKSAVDGRLSARTRSIYHGMEENSKFVLSEAINSPHNAVSRLSLQQAVKVSFLNETADGCLFSEEDIARAVTNCYNNNRSTFRMSLPENLDQKGKTERERRERARRTRKLKKRGKQLEGDEEKRMWQEVTSDLMSDEEKMKEGNLSFWLVKSPPWRSDELTDLCRTLDGRLRSADDGYILQRLNRNEQSDRPKPHVRFRPEHILI